MVQKSLIHYIVNQVDVRVIRNMKVNTDRRLLLTDSKIITSKKDIPQIYEIVGLDVLENIGKLE